MNKLLARFGIRTFRTYNLWCGWPEPYRSFKDRREAIAEAIAAVNDGSRRWEDRHRAMDVELTAGFRIGRNLEVKYSKLIGQYRREES